MDIDRMHTLLTALLPHEPRELRARQLLSEQNRTVRRRPVQLEHVLRQIDADDVNLFHGCLLRSRPTNLSGPD